MILRVLLYIFRKVIVGILIEMILLILMTKVRGRLMGVMSISSNNINNNKNKFD